MAVLHAGHYVSYHGWSEKLWRRIPGWWFSVAYGAMASDVIVFMESNNTPFVYFQW